jgi:Predicted hydrolases or acyltransferases (alpha/beta hydrolase superfamily)
MQNTFTSKDGLKVAYYVDDFTHPWSKPETILLLHPAMGNSRRWFSWMPTLLQSYRVVRMDLRGHGHSEIPAESAPFSLDLLVSDASQLVDLVSDGPIHVVGNSAGGYVAQQLAIKHPEQVKTLSSFAATPGLKHSHAPTWIPKIKELGFKEFLAATIHERFDENADPRTVKWFIEQAGSNDPNFIARFVLHMCTHDFMDELVRIQCPTLLVAAGRESIGKADAYVEMKNRIPNCELRYIDTAAHNICDGYPQQCLQYLLEFLSIQSGVTQQ